MTHSFASHDYGEVTTKEENYPVHHSTISVVQSSVYTLPNVFAAHFKKAVYNHWTPSEIESLALYTSVMRLMCIIH